MASPKMPSTIFLVSNATVFTVMSLNVYSNTFIWGESSVSGKVRFRIRRRWDPFVDVLRDGVHVAIGITWIEPRNYVIVVIVPTVVEVVENGRPIENDGGGDDLAGWRFGGGGRGCARTFRWQQPGDFRRGEQGKGWEGRIRKRSSLWRYVAAG